MFYYVLVPNILGHFFILQYFNNIYVQYILCGENPPILDCVAVCWFFYRDFLKFYLRL